MHDIPPSDLTLSRPVAEIIRLRSSKRAYQDQPIEPKVRDLLDAFTEAHHEGVFGNRVRLSLQEMGPPSFKQLRESGTYGFIKGARYYLIGAVERADDNMEDFGFCFERALLRCTDLGLGTCWLGGTLNRSSFGQRMGTQPSEIVPAVSPVGYATHRRALRDVVIRLGAGSHKRHPWSKIFFHSTFDAPLSETAAGKFRQPLEMLRLAPSASNQQPWRVVQTAPGTYHLFLHRTAMYRAKLLRIPEVDLQRIDMGIAMCHFTLSVQEAGLEGSWVRSPPDDLPLPAHTHYVASWMSS